MKLNLQREDKWHVWATTRPAESVHVAHLQQSVSSWRSKQAMSLLQSSSSWHSSNHHPKYTYWTNSWVTAYRLTRPPRFCWIAIPISPRQWSWSCLARRMRFPSSGNITPQTHTREWGSLVDSGIEGCPLQLIHEAAILTGK